MMADDESLDEILSGTNTPPEETEAQPDAPVRDEHGRFAPKAGEEQPELIEVQDEQIDAEPEHNAPVAAVTAERRKRQAETARADALEQQLAELRGQVSVLTQQRTASPAQPQPEPVKPPEFWEAPDKYVEHALSPFQQQIAAITFRASRAEALAEHGREVVTAAQDAIKAEVQSGRINGEALKAQLAKSADPVGDIVRWHRSSPAVQETTLREKLRAELMAEFGIDPNKPAQLSTPSQPRNPVVKLPPSLNRIPAGHAAPERDESLDEVLSASRRRA